MIDNTYWKDLLRKKSNKNRIPCLIICNRKLPMMSKFIAKYWRVLQVNLELRETSQNNHLWHLKETKTCKKLKETIGSKMGKFLKPIWKTEKGDLSLATQVNHHCIAQRLLTLVHSRNTKDSKTVFHNSNSKAYSSFTLWNAHYEKSNMLEKLKKLSKIYHCQFAF